MASSVYIYFPNIIGYFRLALLFVAWMFFEDNTICIPCYCTSALLDAFDGYFARKLHQTSAFGAWLDVIVDNIGRTMMWTAVVKWGWVVSSLEWTVFVCTHQMGSRWKEEFASAPKWAKAVMENGFYTPVGVFTIAGIHGLPIAFYYRIFPFPWFLPPKWIYWTIVIILALGRCLGAAVELWVVLKHMQHLVELSNNAKQ